MSNERELQQIREAADYFMPKGAFVAGGALTSVFTGTKISDVDLYFKSNEDFEDAIYSAYDENLWCVSATDRAVTFVRDGCVVQLMRFSFFETAHSIFDAFDFTACMAAYDIDAGQFVFHEDFFKHASQRHLSFHSGTRFPFGSLLRVLKYQARGYTIGKGDLLRIALCCHKTNLESWDDLARAVGGQYGRRVELDATGPFSIEAAVSVIQAGDFTVPDDGDAMPGNAEALIAYLKNNTAPAS